jgi:hypothetical protein
MYDEIVTEYNTLRYQYDGHFKKKVFYTTMKNYFLTKKQIHISAVGQEIA